MRILVDQHHAGLLRSLQYLVEDRLGGELYVPRGHEWWDEGYWRFGEVYGDDRLAGQYLANWTGPVMFDSEFPDHSISGVTLDEARTMRWDVILATVDENQTGFARFARETGALYAVACGNTGQNIDWALDPVALISSQTPLQGRGVRIGQEFDAEGLFGFRPITDPYRIGSFVNVMPQLPCWEFLERAQERLTEYSFTIAGINGPDGIIKPITAIAERMAACGWGWHDKVTGDGFGHVVNMWAALGRPLIGHASHYAGQRSEGLWVDGETCIDLGQRGLNDSLAMVREISADPERHAAMGRAIRARFDAIWDFAADAEKVRDLFSLVPA